jgi:hypothetical protein
METQFFVGLVTEFCRDVRDFDRLSRTSFMSISNFTRRVDGPRTFGAGDLDQIGGHDLGEGLACRIVRLHFGQSSAERFASDKSRDFGLPPGFGLGRPFFQRVAAPMLGSNPINSYSLYRKQSCHNCDPLRIELLPAKGSPLSRAPLSIESPAVNPEPPGTSFFREDKGVFQVSPLSVRLSVAWLRIAFSIFPTATMRSRLTAWAVELTGHLSRSCRCAGRFGR